MRTGSPVSALGRERGHGSTCCSLRRAGTIRAFTSMSPKEVARFVASRFYEKESLEGSKNLLGRQAAKGPRQGLEPGGR